MAVGGDAHSAAVGQAAAADSVCVPWSPAFETGGGPAAADGCNCGEPGSLPAQCRLQAWAAFYRTAHGVGQRVPEGVEFADWVEHGLVLGDAGRDGGIFGGHRTRADYL